MPSRRLLATVVLSGVLAACAQPEAELGDLGLDPEQAVQADVVEAAPEPLPLTSPAPTAAEASDDPAAPAPSDGAEEPDGGSSTSAPSPTAAPSPSPPPTGGGAPARPITLLALADRSGDAGLSVAGYADLIGFEMVWIGDEVAVTLRFDGSLPTRLADGEVQGVGVDLGSDADGESEYQLFAGGNADGWFAYFESPSGQQQYPGTFTLAGSTMTFRVPWNSIGSPTRGPVRVFVDWSEPGLVLNNVGEDTLDGEPHTFDRNP